MDSKVEIGNYILHCSRRGNFANYMIKYLAAVKVADEVPGAIFSGYQFPAYGIDFPNIDGDLDTSAAFHDDMHIDLMRLKYLLRNGIKKVDIGGHYQRIEYMPDLDKARSIFPLQQEHGVKFDESHIVCPIRGGEILDAHHSGYTVLPVNYYKDVLRKEEGIPVFMGQIEPNIYTDALRQAFPDAVFLPSQGAVSDFNTIYKANRVILPVSTFAWLAAWLSNAQRIILPVFGLFHFQDFPENDLLPVFDPRYIFYRFPRHKAAPLHLLEEDHKSIDGSWHEAPPFSLYRRHL